MRHWLGDMTKERLQGVLEALQGAVLSLDPSGYRSGAEAWTLASGPLRANAHGATAGLAFWIALGTDAKTKRPHTRFAGMLQFYMRHRADQSTQDQARIHAAAAAAASALETASAQDMRVVVEGWELLEVVSASDWTEVQMSFDLALGAVEG